MSSNLSHSASSATLASSASTASLTGIVIDNPPPSDQLTADNAQNASTLSGVTMTDVVKLVADIETLIKKVTVLSHFTSHVPKLNNAESVNYTFSPGSYQYSTEKLFTLCWSTLG